MLIKVRLCGSAWHGSQRCVRRDVTQLNSLSYFISRERKSKIKKKKKKKKRENNVFFAGQSEFCNTGRQGESNHKQRIRFTNHH